MIMPKRLVFDGSQRSQEINLANTGRDTAVYAISFVNYEMTEDGSFKEIRDPQEGQRFATDFLRYFPRRVTLAPNEAQVIRVQLTRTGNLEDGEYRSHMYFRAVEEQTALGTEEEADSEGISINIKTVFGISIPVIIRHGKSTTKIELTDIQLDSSGSQPILSLAINRSGNMSVYGDLKAEYISPEGKEIEVGLVKGISVYTPNSKRNFSFGLSFPEEVDLSGGKLRVTYTSDKGEVLAIAEKNLLRE
ncbi:hypothetical protein GCM10010465_14250 [Actinomadura fibrosa]